MASEDSHNNNEKGKPEDAKPDDGNLKTQQPDSGQSALEQLLSQEKPPEQTTDNTPIHVETGGGVNLIESGGVGAAAVAPVFIQPDDAGKFIFTKVEYVNSIQQDKIIQENIGLNNAEQQLNPITNEGNSEFVKQNFANNLQQMAGSDLP